MELSSNRTMKLVLSFQRGIQNSTYFPNLSDLDPIFIQFSKYLSQGMGFSYQILGGKPGGKRLANGEWSGVIGMVQRGEADLAISPLIITEDRMKAVNFSYPFFVDSITFVARRVERHSGLSTVLSPFSRDVWFAFLMSSFLMSLILYLFLRKTRDFSDVLVKVSASILHQPVTLSPKDGDSRILFLPWLLGLVFLSNCYTSLLLSFMTFPQLSVVRDVPELSRAVVSDTYRVMIRDTSPFADILSQSESYDVRTVGDAIHWNPEGFGSIEKFLHSSNPNLAFIELRHKLGFLATEFFVSADYFFCIMTSIAVGKTFCCKDKLDTVIHRIVAAGLYQKLLTEKDFKDSSLLFREGNIARKETSKALKLADLSGTFFLLAVGYSFGLAALLVEILFDRNKETAKKRD